MVSFPTQGYSSSREYLAVQGPDKLTMEDFWTLVWEQDVHTILTLLPCQEKGEVRCRACLCCDGAGICSMELEAGVAPKLELSLLPPKAWVQIQLG